MEAAPLDQPLAPPAEPPGGASARPPVGPSAQPPTGPSAQSPSQPLAQPQLEAALLDDPTSFGFFQTVRLLERLHPDRRPVGEFGDPRDEVVRFSVPAAIAFPASEIQALTLSPEELARMAVNFMGATGPSGVLPLRYTVLAMDRARARDHTLQAFLDLFHHRIISLFYKAWEKCHFVVGYERDQRDRITRHLLDLIGLGTTGLENRLEVPDSALIFYAGLLMLPSRPAAALRQILEDYFQVPVEVEQFVGGWYRLPVPTQCSVGQEVDESTQLGLGAVVGDEVWDPQSRVRIRVGPLSRERYDQFLPGGSAYAELRALTRFYGGEQLDFEVQLVLLRDEVPGFVLGGEGPARVPLSWTTWVRTAPMGRDPGDAILNL